MSQRYAFHIVNVFTVDGARLSGNPLCVFPDARGMSDDDMQALARQMNLSETTFVLPAPPSEPTATAHVRIFTPGFEMPFAGHPTLGTASVIGAARGLDRVTLAMRAGLVPVVRGAADTWTLQAARAPTTRAPTATRAQLAAMLSLDEAAVAGPPLWVNTGVEQLVIPLASVAHVRAATPVPALLAEHGFAPSRDEAMAYVWARTGADQIEARFFFTQHGAVIEDPATGSACANLGGWFRATAAPLPLTATISQGTAVHRPSRLTLRVADHIHVSGQTIELGTGTLSLA